MIARSNRTDSPASTPSGIPTRSDNDTAASMRASVCMLSTQSPVSANTANAPSAQAAARTPPYRSTTSTPATVVPTQVIQPRNRVNQPTRSSRNDAKPLNALKTTFGSWAFRCSSSHVWKSLRWVGSDVQTSRSGQRYWLLYPR